MKILVPISDARERASGVAMGDRRRVIVEAVLGQGEALVSGEALADRWEVAGGRIDVTTIAAKSMRGVVELLAAA
jgi:phosphoenolpyruvate synthase/pyruvate phosphate dikinase